MARSYYVTLFVLIFPIIPCFFFYYAWSIVSASLLFSIFGFARHPPVKIRPRSFACSFPLALFYSKVRGNAKASERDIWELRVVKEPNEPEPWLSFVQCSSARAACSSRISRSLAFALVPSDFARSLLAFRPLVPDRTIKLRCELGDVFLAASFVWFLNERLQ